MKEHLGGAKLEYRQIKGGLSPQISNVITYKKFFQVASELKVHKKATKNKLSFS